MKQTYIGRRDAGCRHRFQTAIDGIDGDKLNALISNDSRECVVLDVALLEMTPTGDAQSVALSRIRLSHEQFHLTAIQIVSLLHDGKFDDAQSLLDSEFVQVSDSLIAKLGAFSKID